MFKKKCQNCNNQISKKYQYCPSCGTNLNEEDLGMFGANDFDPSLNQIKFPKGLNMLFNTLMKSLDKEMKNSMKEQAKQNKNPNLKKNGISISISTVPGKEPNIKVNSFGNEKLKEQKEKTKIKRTKTLPSNMVKTGKLPKKEPLTNVRRLSDKIIYEIKIPGVKSLKDISINQLENSIEIRALAKDKAYIKLIPVGLPIMDYTLDKGKLVLELDTKN